MPETTPMMKQYLSIRKKYKGTILFFRLGDFYEMFQQDALEVSALLGLTLTHRNGVPMCGIPYHAAQTYIARLLKAGKKIAVCEQTKLPLPGKGLAEREVIQIITPGTIVDEDLLDGNANNYILAMGRTGDAISLAWADLSTGELLASSIPWKDRVERIRREFARLNPREIIVQESILTDDGALGAFLVDRNDLTVNRYPDWLFDAEGSRERLKRLFGVENLKGFGVSDSSTEIFSCGVLLEYLEESSKHAVSHFSGIKIVKDDEFMGLDESTQKNLELLHNLQDGSRKFSLLEVLDCTKTAMGARKLRNWILHPLLDPDAVRERLDRTESLYRDQAMLSVVRKELSGFLDLERLSSRIALEKAHAKDLLGVLASLDAFVRIDVLLEGNELFRESEIESRRGAIREASGLIRNSIRDDPSVLLTEGNIIRDGFNRELDELRSMKTNSRQFLEKYLEDEKSGTGIPTLKIKYNRIIGFYLEVTKSNLHLIPAHFIRRQSIVGGERFTTDRLIELETELNSASERIVDLEKNLFLEVRSRIKAFVPDFMAVCRHISTIDCIQSFAFNATRYGYARPVVSGASLLKITDGRHPVVEAHLPPGQFVPNSLELNGDESFFALITGPNMAGKSTFLRQTALIVLMAQIGSFVPAGEALVGMTDRIFCRVGASDNLARGESTFLVEMNETANILRSATKNSLVIMDEVGRGTGTNDGLSIAWAVTEYLVGVLKSKTLFATHYHELTAMNHASVRNLSMEISERSGEIVFLKRVKDGPSANSYGLHVARLAGLPEPVLERAAEILTALVRTEKSLPESASRTGGSVRPIASGMPPPRQGSLFDPRELLWEQLGSLDIDSLTPLDALNLLSLWKEEFLGKG